MTLVPRPGPRARLTAALERCSERTRLVLALLLVERLTVAETADALGTTTARVEREYHDAVEELGRITRRGGTLTSRPRRMTVERLRRAS